MQRVDQHPGGDALDITIHLFVDTPDLVVLALDLYLMRAISDVNQVIIDHRV
jgi:hypothetical protein